MAHFYAETSTEYHILFTRVASMGLQSIATSSLLLSAAQAVAVVHAAAATATLQGPPRHYNFDPREIKGPQLIGILFGIVVFTATITAVIVLLLKSGSWKKFLEEAASGAPITWPPSGQQGKASVVPALSTYPELYDNLIAASKTLPKIVDIGTIEGATVTLRPVQKADLGKLHEASSGRPLYDESAYDPLRIWGWVNRDSATDSGEVKEIETPYASLEAFTSYVNGRGPVTQICIEHGIYKNPIGMISLSNNVPKYLSIEIDNIWLTPAFQGKKIGYEAVYHVLSRLFKLGYRRVTFATDSRDMIGRKFIERCGFKLEGVLQKHRIVSSRNRDSASYALLNSDWEGDGEASMKKMLGISPAPTAHKIIEIESGKEVEFNIKQSKIRAAKQSNTTDATATATTESEAAVEATTQSPAPKATRKTSKKKV